MYDFIGGTESTLGLGLIAVAGHAVGFMVCIEARDKDGTGSTNEDDDVRHLDDSSKPLSWI